MPSRSRDLLIKENENLLQLSQMTNLKIIILFDNFHCIIFFFIHLGLEKYFTIIRL